MPGVTARARRTHGRDRRAAATMPARIEVAYVKTLELEAPKPLARGGRAAPPPPRPRAPPGARSSVEPAALGSVGGRRAGRRGGDQRPWRQPASGAGTSARPRPSPPSRPAAPSPTRPAPASAAAGGLGGRGLRLAQGSTRVSYLLTGNWRGESERQRRGRVDQDRRPLPGQRRPCTPARSSRRSSRRRMMSEGRIVAGRPGARSLRGGDQGRDARRPAGERRSSRPMP